MTSDITPASTNEPTDSISVSLVEADREFEACLGGPCPATAEDIFLATYERMKEGGLSPTAMVRLVASAMTRITFEAVAVRQQLDVEMANLETAYDALSETQAEHVDERLLDVAPAYRTLLRLEFDTFH